MRRTVRAMLAATGILAALGCGGIWQQATNQAAMDEIYTMQGKMGSVQPGPGKDAVDAILQQALTGAASGEFGVIEIATFSVAFDAAIADGQVSDVEVTSVQAAYDDATR